MLSLLITQSKINALRFPFLRSPLRKRAHKRRIPFYCIVLCHGNRLSTVDPLSKIFSLPSPATLSPNLSFLHNLFNFTHSYILQVKRYEADVAQPKPPTYCMRCGQQTYVKSLCLLRAASVSLIAFAVVSFCLILSVNELVTSWGCDPDLLTAPARSSHWVALFIMRWWSRSALLLKSVAKPKTLIVMVISWLASYLPGTTGRIPGLCPLAPCFALSECLWQTQPGCNHSCNEELLTAREVALFLLMLLMLILSDTGGGGLLGSFSFPGYIDIPGGDDCSRIRWTWSLQFDWADWYAFRYSSYVIFDNEPEDLTCGKARPAGWSYLINMISKWTYLFYCYYILNLSRSEQDRISMFIPFRFLIPPLSIFLNSSISASGWDIWNAISLSVHACRSS